MFISNTVIAQKTTGDAVIFCKKLMDTAFCIGISLKF